MGTLAGKTGLVRNGSSTVGYIDSWNAEMSADIFEVTAFGDTHKKREYGLADASGSIKGTLDITDAQQKTFIESFGVGGTLTKYNLNLYFSGDYKLYGSVVLSGLSLETPVGGKQNFSANWQADGGMYVDIT
jgi:hypothetical protein